MNSKRFLLFTFAITLAGCIPSLHPLYTPKDVIYDPKLIGAWTEPNSSDWGTWEFRVATEPNSYTMIFTDKDKKIGSFKVHLLKLDKTLFLDIFPGNDSNLQQLNSLYAMHLLPAHTFMKIDQIEPTLKMRFMDAKNFAKRLEKEPKLLKHEILEDSGAEIVLTASTKELQEFMRKHANDKDVFGEPSNMKRVLPPDSNKPADPNAKK
jgi:hypothetical protein